MRERLSGRRHANWALIPVKSLDRAKSRLAPVLNASERRVLAVLMLQDVLEQAIQCPLVEHIAVVTADTDIAGMLRKWPVRVIDEQQPRGQSRAVRYACDRLAAAGASSVVVLSADIPTALASEVGELLQAATRSPSVVVATDRHGTGSNGLALSPPTAIHPCFGHNSLRRHHESAARNGVPVATLRLRGLALDIDDPSDLMLLLQPSSACRSGEFLISWGIADRVRRHLAATARTAAGE
jgi:2-phospho-L-lactate guanylyltransferase